ncbi:MAG: MerR family transcriptional regulator [Micrococcales bacterium]|nr:MerR family transcriptional regulator [Micrococcales bacterium]
MSDAESTYLLGIGDFSRFAMLSVRMLRHYDERGLLVPWHVDPGNGYRFYAPAQLKTAARIRVLRDSGCGIAQIATMLPLFDDADALRQALADHARSLDAAAQQIADQQALLTTILEQVKEPTMPVTVEERTVPAMQVIALRRTVPTYGAEGALWAELDQLVKTSAGLPREQFGPHAGATFYDADFRESDIDMAVWWEYTGDDEPEGFQRTTIPEQRVAWATLYGSYEGAGAVCQAIGDWVSHRGLTVSGPMFNIYVVSPGQTSDPESWVTEINFPVAG